MDPWSLGAVPTMVDTAVRYSIRCEMCSRSKLVMGRLLAEPTFCRKRSFNPRLPELSARRPSDQIKIAAQLREAS